MILVFVFPLPTRGPRFRALSFFRFIRHAPLSLRLFSTSLSTNHMKTDLINYSQLALSFGNKQTKVPKVALVF